jgi:predicted small metal-binding protein
MDNGQWRNTQKEQSMPKLINCECGQTVRADTDDELVTIVDGHVKSDHPELAGKMSREDILAMAEVV